MQWRRELVLTLNENQSSRFLVHHFHHFPFRVHRPYDNILMTLSLSVFEHAYQRRGVA